MIPDASPPRAPSKLDSRGVEELAAVAAVEKEMFPPLTVADIQAEFDRVNVRRAFVDSLQREGEKLHAERQRLSGDYQKGDLRFPTRKERLAALDPNRIPQAKTELDGIDHLKALTDALQPPETKEIPRSEVYPVGNPALKKQVGGSHYKGLAIQPVEYCQRNNLGFCESSVVKYVTRWQSKAGVEDLKKARHFIDLLIEMTEADAKKATYCGDARH